MCPRPLVRNSRMLCPAGRSARSAEPAHVPRVIRSGPRRTSQVVRFPRDDSSDVDVPRLNRKTLILRGAIKDGKRVARVEAESEGIGRLNERANYGVA